jgi:hypothetical protein
MLARYAQDFLWYTLRQFKDLAISDQGQKRSRVQFRHKPQSPQRRDHALDDFLMAELSDVFNISSFRGSEL